MTFLLGKWLQALTRNAAVGAHTRRGASRPRPHRIVPRLEALEDRRRQANRTWATAPAREFAVWFSQHPNNIAGGSAKRKKKIIRAHEARGGHFSHYLAMAFPSAEKKMSGICAMG
jgi:hypothetical protein